MKHYTATDFICIGAYYPLGDNRLHLGYYIKNYIGKHPSEILTSKYFGFIYDRTN